MKVSNIVENHDTMQFTLSGTDMCIANALRRTLLSDIPCVVMKTMPSNKCNVDITINTSRFNNEILKQRLACIPIHITDIGDHINQLEIELDIENTTEDFIYVTTEDIKIKNKSTDQYLKKDDVIEMFPANPQTGYFIDIIRLRPKLTPDSPGERVAFTAKLDIGTAGENSMYNMVSTCTYGNTQDDERVTEQYKVKEQELKDSGMAYDNIVFEMNNWKLLDAQRIFLKNSFDFNIKTVGVYTCKELLKIACDCLIDKMSNLIAKFKNNDESNDVKIESTSSTIENGYDIILQNEDHTVGMILQYLLYSMHYDGDKTMSFCGCKKFHPHDSHIIVRIGYKTETELSIVTDDFVGALQAANIIYNDLKNLF